MLINDADDRRPIHRFQRAVVSNTNPWMRITSDEATYTKINTEGRVWGYESFTLMRKTQDTKMC